MKREFTFWLPRILAGLYAGFLAMFAFDVFSEHGGFVQTLGAFAIHLIPAGTVLILLALSWRWELASGLLFILAGVAYSIMVGFRVDWSLVIAGPLLAVGILFLVDWTVRRKQVIL